MPTPSSGTPSVDFGEESGAVQLGSLVLRNSGVDKDREVTRMSRQSPLIQKEFDARLDEFDAIWSSGKAPDIQDFLSSTDLKTPGG